MKYTSKGVPKNWDGKDWQTHKWAMITAFKETDLKDIAVGDLTKAMLATASAEKKEDFTKKQLKIMRMIVESAPPEVLQQIRDKETHRICEKRFSICMNIAELRNQGIYDSSRGT